MFAVSNLVPETASWKKKYMLVILSNEPRSLAKLALQRWIGKYCTVRLPEPDENGSNVCQGRCTPNAFTTLANCNNLFNENWLKLTQINCLCCNKNKVLRSLLSPAGRRALLHFRLAPGYCNLLVLVLYCEQ